MNTHKKGIKLENFIAEKLQQIFKENPPIRRTKASSGGMRNSEIGDILCKDFYIEAKNHEAATISLKVWDKLINSIPMNSDKDPLYIIQRPTGEILITLKFDDFCAYMKRSTDADR